MACYGLGVQKPSFVEQGVCAYLFVKPLVQFNTGAGSLAKIVGMCGITLGANTMKELRQQDKKGIVPAASKVSAKYRDERRKRRAQRKTKADQNAYQAGAFSLSSKPDITTHKKRKRSEKNSVKQTDVPM